MTDELKVVGREEDVTRFKRGDLIVIHLELRDQVFLDAPHGETGVVMELSYKDNEYLYNLPVVQFGTPSNELRMVNPDYMIVIQRADGSEPELDRLAAAEVKTQAKIAELAAQGNQT